MSVGITSVRVIPLHRFLLAFAKATDVSTLAVTAFSDRERHPECASPILAASYNFAIVPGPQATTIGAANANPTQNLRFMSISSALGASSAVIISGSSAMPQMGQAPGPI